MTTFHCLIYAIVHAFAEFLPVGVAAHDRLLPWTLQWPTPSAEFVGLLQLATFLALLFSLRHDWASMISSTLGMVAYRRRPMTVDERLPIYITIATLVTALGWYYLKDVTAAFFGSPYRVLFSWLVGALLLAFAESMGRRSRGLLDWNGLDAFWMGLFQILLLVPGCGRSVGIIAGAGIRNYHRETAVKLSLLLATPLLGAAAYSHLRNVSWGSAAQFGDMHWLSLISAFLTAFLASLLAIGGLNKQAQKNRPFRNFILFRIFITAVVGGVLWGRELGWI